MRKAPSFILVALLCTASPAAFGAGYIKFDGIDGEFMANGKGGYLEVESWSFGAGGPGGAAPTSGPGSVSLKRRTDKASPLLSKAYAQGKLFPVVEILKSAGQPGAYMKYELKNVMISSYTLGADSGRPMESLSLNFAQIQVMHVGQKEPPAINKVTPSANNVNAGQNVVFTVQATGDCQRARIDFGDGTSGPEFAIVSLKGQPPPSHTYAKGGTFEAKAFGILDPMAKQAAPPPPPPSGQLCGGHATTNIVVTQTKILAPGRK